MSDNPKDPLLNSGPDYQRELFTRFCREARGFSREHVENVAGNLIINSIRQRCSTRAAAEAGFDELFGRMKQLLVDHYDMNGRKRGIFPYNQVVEAPFFDARPRRH